MIRRFFTKAVLVAASTAAAFALACAAQAQTWPEKPIMFIVPFAPGGVADVITRAVTPGLSEALGQPVVVENRGGAGGTVGTAIGARSAPDGYTFIVPAASHTTTPSLYSNLSFDPIKDFAPVTQIASVPYLLVVPASGPATLDEFISLAKARPGQLTFGSAGNGSSNHLAGELLASALGTSFVHVPYKGSAPALADLLGGQIFFMFDTINTSRGLVGAGKLRALGVGVRNPSMIMPEVPPIANAVPGFEAATWVGLLAPANTPKGIIARMQKEVEKVLKRPDVQERLSASGAEPVGSTPEEFTAYMTSELQKWSKVVKQAKIKPVQ